MSHRAAGRESSCLPPPPARTRSRMVSEASVAHFGYLSRYTIPPARAEEGLLRPAARGPYATSALPDLIPCRTHSHREPRPRKGQLPAWQGGPGPEGAADTGATEYPRRSGAQGPRRASGKGAKFTPV